MKLDLNKLNQRVEIFAEQNISSRESTAYVSLGNEEEDNVKDLHKHILDSRRKSVE